MNLACTYGRWTLGYGDVLTNSETLFMPNTKYPREDNGQGLCSTLPDPEQSEEMLLFANSQQCLQITRGPHKSEYSKCIAKMCCLKLIMEPRQNKVSAQIGFRSSYIGQCEHQTRKCKQSVFLLYNTAHGVVFGSRQKLNDQIRYFSDTITNIFGQVKIIVVEVEKVQLKQGGAQADKKKVIKRISGKLKGVYNQQKLSEIYVRASKQFVTKVFYNPTNLHFRGK